MKNMFEDSSSEEEDELPQINIQKGGGEPKVE